MGLPVCYDKRKIMIGEVKGKDIQAKRRNRVDMLKR